MIGGAIPARKPGQEPPVKLSDPMTYEVAYDPEVGRVSTYWNSKIDEIVHVRAELKEEIIREAAISELQRLGYTVTPPEGRP